ncbi:hypothetical protein AaE_014460 [Aphanomyces astaci]|uniref:Tc1-like transposase DDE domain-containing protein n=1 Tax=Aphanomyces astaci TaxID=112090 RepID=A0A6A4Z6G2_APHAT|nr:hypothetical protein AaE_014460 [Aphanomyces astaci]
MAERAAKSKKFITKVMFLAAVARPRYDAHKKQMFDGKIGIWPFVEEVAAVRSSKNRPKGTLELTTQSVNADVYQDMVMNEVVPAIQVKMPRGVVVKLQQDNASPHRCVTTELIARHGVDSIEVANQPPNSPDFNVLDLGFFNSIQSLQQQKVARSIGELIAAVEEAFYELPVTILGKTFITLQKVMELSMGCSGGNTYTMPHMSKNARIKDLPSFNVECDATIYAGALDSLNCQNQV